MDGLRPRGAVCPGPMALLGSCLWALWTGPHNNTWFYLFCANVWEPLTSPSETDFLPFSGIHERICDPFSKRTTFLILLFVFPGLSFPSLPLPFPSSRNDFPGCLEFCSWRLIPLLNHFLSDLALWVMSYVGISCFMPLSLYPSVALAQLPWLEIQAGAFQAYLFPLYSNYLLAKPICSWLVESVNRGEFINLLIV